MDKKFKNKSVPVEKVEWDYAEYEDAKKKGGYGKIMEMNVKVYQDTIKIARGAEYFVPELGYRTLPSEKIAEMQEGTRFYSEEFNVDGIPARDEETVVKVERDDCLDVGLRLKSEGYNVAVLNLASLYKPGGAVLNGSRAQEESLFRRTNLFQSMYQFVEYGKDYGVPVSKEHRYPLDGNFGGVYTPNAFVFRSSGDDGYRLIDSVEMSFVSVAGYKWPELTADNRIVDSLVDTVKNKIRTIFRIGLTHGHDALVLGAFGCGAYCNPPEHIAQLFREVMEEAEFRNKFRLLDFAILDNGNSHGSHNPHGNFQPFHDVFCG